jgi:acyl-coenzyme A synthetase/AMP-(fatty) acid ligase
MSACAVMRPIYGASPGWSIPRAGASPPATPVRGFPDPDHAARRMLVCVGASYACPQKEDVRVGEITALRGVTGARVDACVRLGAPMTAPVRNSAAARTAHNLAWILLEQSGEPAGKLRALVTAEATWTLADLRDRTVGMAAALTARGIGRRDIVLLRAPDSPEWIAAFLGAVRCGAVVALAGMGITGERLRDVAERVSPRLVISDGPQVLPGVAQLELADLAVGAPHGPDDPGICAVRLDDPCYMLLTSGTTGPSKWAVHRHRDIPGCIATYGRRVLKLRPGDLVWSVAALPTSYGLGKSMYFPLGMGAAAWIESHSRDPERLEIACRDFGVNVVAGVPTWWARLARHVREGRVDRSAFAGVRLAVAAGELLDGRVWDAVAETTGMRIVNSLGSSEATNLYTSDVVGSPAAGRTGWVVPGYRLRIAPVEGAPPGAGELLVSGPTVMAEYFGNPEATAQTLTDGWLHTGDLVEWVPDGQVRILGRVGDRIKVGASWVDPTRVREALLADPDVADAICVPVIDDDGVTRLVAAVATPRPGPDLEERLRERLSALPAPERPRALVVDAELPVTASGKVDRTELNARARAALRNPNQKVMHGH